MKKIKRIIIIFLFSCIVFFGYKIDLFAMGGVDTGTIGKAMVEAPEYTFTALDDTPVFTNGSGHKATILIFGSTTCDNTSYTLSEVAKSDWVKSPDIQVIFAEVKQSSKEDVQTFADQYGSEDIISCYDTTSKTNSAMWSYIMEYYNGSESGGTMPFTVLIDENNMIRNIHLDGAKSADDLISELNNFTDTGYTTSDPYYGMNANLKISGTEDYVSANEVFRLTNEARNQNGLGSLNMDKELTEAAMQRAAEISIYYSHLRPDGSSSSSVFPYQEKAIGENIAVGYKDSDSVTNGWLDSPGHYANIMNCDATNIGIGCFVDDTGRRYWVQCFDANEDHIEPEISNRGIEKIIPVKTTFVTLGTDEKQRFECKDTTVEIQMKVWNTNEKNQWSTPTLDSSIFSFESSDPTVATVDEYGRITLQDAGTAVITATLKGDVPLSVSQVIEKEEHQIVTTDTSHYCSVCGDVLWEKTDDVDLTNPDDNTQENQKHIFTALDGTKVHIDDVDYKATVLIFGHTTCDFISAELSEVAASTWVKDPNIRVIFAECSRRSKEEVNEFADRYCGTDIITCYDDTSFSIFEAMAGYVKEYHGVSSFSTVVTVLLDGQNQIQNVYSNGAVSAKDILAGIQEFADVDNGFDGLYEDQNVNLLIWGTEDYISANTIYQLVNQERNANGLASLSFDKELTETAMQRAAELAIFYSHTRPDGSECFSAFPNQEVDKAENIAAGYKDAEEVMQGWLDSPGHYANIMNSDMKNIGIGCFVDDRGCCYWVQCFDSNEEHSEPEMENRRVAKEISTRAANISLNTEPKRRSYPCNSTEKSIMNVWNVNSGVVGSRFSLDKSLFDFESDNPAVATVDEYGRITLLDAGTAVITATLKGDVPLSVSQVIEKEEHQIVTTDTSHYCSVCGTVLWKKTDEVDPTAPDDGTVEPGENVSKPDNTSQPGGNVSKPNNTLQSGGNVPNTNNTSTYKPEKSQIKSIKISAPKKVLKAGATMKLKAVVKTIGSGKANKKLKWSSSKKKYATVNQKGKVRAKKAGKGKSVTITAKATDGSGKKAKIKIRIK